MTETESPAGLRPLEAIIAPEVIGDEFSMAIRNLAKFAAIDTVLEIGSSSGDGSTLAWVQGLKQNPRKPKLFCIEVSKVRWEALEQRWRPEGFVECFQGSSVELQQFPTVEQVTEFYHAVPGPLRNWPLEQVLGWMQEEISCIREENVRTGVIREIKRSRGIEHFGAVLIDGSEFTGNAELDEVYGAEFILLGDTQTFKCHQAHRRLLDDPGYELIAENAELRNGYSIFRRTHGTFTDPLPPDAPVNYFTIVLNGEPFIRHHIEVLKQLSFRWHWHIVEGAATLSHDTGWSKATGGNLQGDRHLLGLSVDGTSAYLEELVVLYPGQITLHRPQGGQLWDGKIAMIAEPIKHIFEDSILWEIDADELWTVEQLEEGRRMFFESPEKAAAWFWCDFFVGENLVISSRNCYAQNPAQEWLRAWKFQPGMRWLTHEPPVLARRRHDGGWDDLAQGRAFTHQETEARGLVFQHMAYATESQVAFKEQYYGYEGAVESWKRLRDAEVFPVQLRDYFTWVTDHTEVNTAASRGIVPLAVGVPGQRHWQFSQHRAARAALQGTHPTIVVDGIFFQLNNTGIGKMWLETLKQWGASETGRHVVLLDRDGTAPDIPGVRKRWFPPFNHLDAGGDAVRLQNVCDEMAAGVFISTYYSSPLSTPSVAMVYDMISEWLSLPLTDWQWAQKRLHILQATRFACISQSTADDLLRFYPKISRDAVEVSLLAAPPSYHPASAEAMETFLTKHQIDRPYLLVVGERVGYRVGSHGYKNAGLLFRGWSLLPEEERREIQIVCAGGKPQLEESLRIIAPDAEVKIIYFSEEDLALAYSGALALAYPSLYEGFGLPVLEAMACGCPVITCRRASLAEVAGDAAIFVDPWSPGEMLSAIRALRDDPALRSDQVARGLAQAASFSYAKTANVLGRLLLETAAMAEDATPDRTLQTWRELRTLQKQVFDTGESLQRVQHENRKVLQKIGKLSALLTTMKKDAKRASRKLPPLKKLWNRICGR